MMKEVTQNLEELLHSGYRYALSLTHDKVRAEDVVQDAWLAVLKAKGPHSRPYLFSAVRSRFLNLNKREQLVTVVALDDVPQMEEQVDVTNSLDAMGYLEYPLLEEALDSLRSVEREALFLMAVEGYTANEIATFTKQPRGTVLSHIHRAKQKIRRFLATHDVEVRHER